MTITDVDIFRYALPLATPLQLKEHRLTERNGCLIRLHSDTGVTAWGEAAPLPGFSTESFDDTRIQLTRTADWLRGQELSTDLAGLSGQFDRWLAAHDLFPSVRCALETAALNLLAAEKAIPLARVLAVSPVETVHVNGLITDENNVTEIVRGLYRDGYRAVKLKVGRDTVDNDIARTQDAYHELGSGTALRLDANRAWSFDDAVRFARGISDCEIEYLEEPLADPTRLGEFHESTGLSVAIDETLIGTPPDRLAGLSFLSAVVAKPTLLGGFERTATLARAARQLKMKVVISSSFESSLGIAALAQLAAAFDSRHTAAGLDTLGRFEHDLLVDAIDHAHGRMRIGQLARVAATVDLSRLTEVTRE